MVKIISTRGINNSGFIRSDDPCPARRMDWAAKPRVGVSDKKRVFRAQALRFSSIILFPTTTASCARPDGRKRRVYPQ